MNEQAISLAQLVLAGLTLVGSGFAAYFGMQWRLRRDVVEMRKDIEAHKTMIDQHGRQIERLENRYFTQLP